MVTLPMPDEEPNDRFNLGPEEIPELEPDSQLAVAAAAWNDAGGQILPHIAPSILDS